MAPHWSEFERAILLEVRDRLAAGSIPSSDYTYERIGTYLGRVVNGNTYSPVAQVQYERLQRRRLDPSQPWTEPRLPCGWLIDDFLEEDATFREWVECFDELDKGAYPLGSRAVREAAKERQRRVMASKKVTANADHLASTTTTKRINASGYETATTQSSASRRARQFQKVAEVYAHNKEGIQHTKSTTTVEKMTTRSSYAALGGSTTKGSKVSRYGVAQTVSVAQCEKTEGMLPTAHLPLIAERTLDNETDSSAFLIGVDVLNPNSDTAHDVMQSIHEKFTPASPKHPHVDLGDDHVLPPVTGWDLYARNRETYGKRLRPRFMVLVAMEQLRAPSVLYASRIPRALAAANRIMQGADAGDEVDLALKKELEGESSAVLYGGSSDVEQGKKETPKARSTPMHAPGHVSCKRKAADHENVRPTKQNLKMAGH